MMKQNMVHLKRSAVVNPCVVSIARQMQLEQHLAGLLDGGRMHDQREH